MIGSDGHDEIGEEHMRASTHCHRTSAHAEERTAQIDAAATRQGRSTPGHHRCRSRKVDLACVVVLIHGIGFSGVLSPFILWLFIRRPAVR